MQSHPSRVRGLKFLVDNYEYRKGLSHPSRVRGLKSVLENAIGAFQKVAPFTGAWIEILNPPSVPHFNVQVAPFTGAWIEIGNVK